MENMRIMLKGLTIDDRTKEYVEKRISSIKKLLKEYDGDDPDTLKVEVEINLDKKGKFRVEVMVMTPRNLYRAEETTESVEGSVDLVENQLKTQIRRKKDEIRTKIVRGARSIKKKMAIDETARF
ncbi:MAG: 30S ribosomal interface protein S30EA [Candidatus Moranbacteria bacterium GW2011_GWE2_35_2-]|nr:MAG: 30S ribosomal interface protein S30EA [Candidatus Moranbacteria bacterium GW2011_GWE2_35_2-]KKQ05083.1 MAG: 30S ribosomal interface protein S30EA [Candidatus Moranbacteria bacterium GW2011_GWF1_36_4]KKQ22818.1 MAG: 30S ribosomal interface protein S30EA [Candidatus Moranbacteria bacterium GW2011_GWF2_37_11]KKQ28829.1 MAG: 30S ribosomal interface protein S30EA [Candidatus Moranbacteria bacterium GW2011_GWD1_37_17]KKQ30951.1 MAG: 30S ribosomal interface protein S30EA [Candidatus Moranbacte